MRIFGGIGGSIALGGVCRVPCGSPPILRNPTLAGRPACLPPPPDAEVDFPAGAQAPPGCYAQAGDDGGRGGGQASVGGRAWATAATPPPRWADWGKGMFDVGG